MSNSELDQLLLQKRALQATSLDYLTIVRDHQLQQVFLNIMRELGDETPETALVSLIFRHHGDFQLVWDTQFQGRFGRNRPAVLMALLECFADPHSPAEPPVFTDEQLFTHWQHTTRNLLRFRDAFQPDEPWLYGWACFGEYLCSQVRAPRFVLWNKPVARAVGEGPDADIGKVYADQLPASQRELLELPGIGPATVAALEKQLVEMVLHPARYAPTLQEMSTFWAGDGA